MNRFDRVTSILLLLQTRSVVTAGFLSEHFSVTERTIYRDIRTLENAGVPIGSEAGVGYFLEKGFRLPPVSFTLDEASSLLLGEKLLAASLDQNSHADYTHALNKVRAVLDVSGKDYLSSLDTDIEVLPTGQYYSLEVVGGGGRKIKNSGKSDSDKNGNSSDVQNTLANDQGDKRSELSSGDQWLRECRGVLVRRQVVDISYAAGHMQDLTQRHIEPIGLFYYSLHWHLIAWCRLREGYRDFRLDRIIRFAPVTEQFARHSRDTLQQYLAAQRDKPNLQEVELLFSPEAARFVGEVRYMYGFVSEERAENGVKMIFMMASIDYMARWLLQFTDGVEVVEGDDLRFALAQLSLDLTSHWSAAPRKT